MKILIEAYLIGLDMEDGYSYPLYIQDPSSSSIDFSGWWIHFSLPLDVTVYSFGKVLKN